MRGACAVILIALLAAPVCVRGEGVAQPVAADGKCSVPADEHWTPQEQFVWSRVCVGEEADFNKEAGYGGELDPRKPEGLPENRILRSAFLETILLRDKYRDALTRRGVRIVGARFTEVIDLENAELEHDLWLDKNLLEKGANLSGLTTTHRITFDGSKVTGPLNMNELQAGRDLSMHLGSELAEVYLIYAHIGGTLEFTGSKVAGELVMQGIQAEQLAMSRNAEFAKGVDLSLAHIGGKLDLSGSTVTGKLSMQGIQTEHLLMRAKFADMDLGNAHVRGVLSMSRSTVTGALRMMGLQVDGMLEASWSTFEKGVDLSLAQIGGDLDFTASTVKGNLSMEGIQAGHLLMRAKFADVDLNYAHVRGVLSLYDSTVTGTLQMMGLQVDETLEASWCKCDKGVDLSLAHIGGKLDLTGAQVAGDLNLEGASVGSQLSLALSKVGGEFRCISSEIAGVALLGQKAEFVGPINCHFAKIRELELAGGIFHQDVDFTGAQINGELRLGSSVLARPEWDDKSGLVLRNAKADAIQDLHDAWPLSRLDLSGFTYRSLGGASAAEGDRMAERKAKWFRRWLRRQDPYEPAPYEQLASILRSQGRPSAADDILYDGKERERAQAHFPRNWWLRAMKSFIGYSYHIEWALIWVALFLIAGIAILRISGEGRRNGMPFGIAYSFDMLLPIIRLREKHYKEVDLQGWPRQYFYVHKIMGYVLASFLIAGLVGLTK